MSEPQLKPLDFSKSDQFNAGLSDAIGSIPVIDNFGDSGDVFNHTDWRDLFILLGGNKECYKQFIGIATQLLYRNKQSKIEHKGKALVYSINVSGVKKDIKEYYGMGDLIFPMRIVYATETSRVTADTLTSERAKCALRPVIVPAMMENRRFPATAGAIGFDKMGNDLHTFEIAILSLGDLKGLEMEEVLKMTMNALQGTSMTFKMITDWLNLKSKFSFCNVSSWFSLSAMTSASVTQKEIYKECEDAFPGTIFWAGVHCMMTDVANKRRAATSPSDIRSRLESSNFYGDFKKKQMARNISISSSKVYLDCLETASIVAINYLRASSGLSMQESQIHDMMVKELEKKMEELKIDTEFTAGITTSKPEDVEDYFQSQRAELTANLSAKLKKKREREANEKREEEKRLKDVKRPAKDKTGLHDDKFQ